MVAIKTSLALPSLTKSANSRSTSPAPSPVPSHAGEKRSMLESLPRSRSRSGEGDKRHPITLNNHTHALAVPSASSALRPKLTSLLSGRSTPYHANTSNPLLSPLSSTFPGSASLNGVPTATATLAPAPTPASANPSNPTNGTINPSVANISALETSYVTKVGMSLNDAVNKVFPSPANFVAGAVSNHASALNEAAIVTFKGLCAPRVDKAKEVGQMIASELHLAVNDQYLLRSLLRSAVLKALSIFLSRLESLMINPSTEMTVLHVAKSLKDAENPPASQRFSFLVLRSAWELKKGLNEACSSVITTHEDGKEEQMPKFVKDTLAPWITKVDLLANKIWNPMLAAIKAEATRLVTGQGHDEGLNLSAPATHHLAVPMSTSSSRSLSLPRSGPSYTASALLSASSPAVSSRPSNASPYLRDLASLLSATSRTFAWLSGADGEVQKWKVSIGSAVIWKMLLTVSSIKLIPTDRDHHHHQRRSSPPTNGTISLSQTQALATAGGGSQAAAATALQQTRRSMSSMGIGRLRGSSTPTGKRSPSPPRILESSGIVQARKQVAEVEAFEAILEKFVASLLVPPNEPHAARLPTNSNLNEAVACARGKECSMCNGRYIPLDVEDSDDDEALPREAMQEAMTALASFVVLLRTLASQSKPVAVLIKAITAVDNDKSVILSAPSSLSDICPNLIRALDTLPPLILLQTLVSYIPVRYRFRAPYELWSTSWKDYEQTMKGFHTGEEWVGEVGWELLKECRRIRGRLLAAEQEGEGENRAEEGEGDIGRGGDAGDYRSNGGSSRVDEEGWLELLKLAITELAEVDDLDEDAEIRQESSIATRAPGVSDGGNH